MGTKAERIAVMVLALVLAVIGYALYQAQPLMLYVIAMFGGSSQYEPAFFYTVVGGIIVASVVLGTVTDRLFFGKKEKKSA